MKELRIAYCEDEAVQISYMGKLIAAWTEREKRDCCFCGYQSAGEFLFETEGNYPFDVIILDIDMAGMDGMELARKIRESDDKVPIVFLTNQKEYVFEGYEVNAYRYLLKPVNEKKLAGILHEITEKEEAKKQYLIEKQEGENRKLLLEEIRYLEASGHYLNIHTREDILTVKKSLSQEIQAICAGGKELLDCGFVRTHRSFLVNLDNIDRVCRDSCVLSGGETVPISRNAYRDVNEAFIRYYREIQGGIHR